MTIRDDIQIQWYEDPRIAEITTASNEVSAQDSHDTLATLQDQPEGHQFPFLVSSAGKENLGGGSLVGITSTLQNTQYAPQRSSPRSTTVDTVTTGGTNTVICSGATFQTDGVQRGDWILNWTDQSITEVLTVTSETELQVRTPEGLAASSNDFAVNDVLTVWEVSEFQLAGGNFVAIDDVGGDINPLFTVFGRFATRTSAASATLQELQDIQYSSFNGGITVDLINGVSGTVFPTGTERQPVNNFTDALTIAQTRGFLTFYVVGDATIDSANNYTDYRFIGQGQNLSTFTLAAAANFTNASFEEATCTGTLDGDSHIENCIIDDLTFVSGVISNCILNPGTITLGGSQTAHFINCASGVPGVSTPIIDCGGSGQPLALRNYNGGIELENKTGSDSVSIDLNSGQIVLDSTVTNGTIVCRGVGKLTDNSSGATVVNEILSVPEIWGYVLDGTFTAEEIMRLMASAAAAKVSGLDVLNPVFRNLDDNKNRITATTDSFGNRSSITLDVTP